jgi:hypothetical protein
MTLAASRAYFGLQTLARWHLGRADCTISLAMIAAARDDAVALARDLPGWNRTGRFVVIVDEHGQGRRGADRGYKLA